MELGASMHNLISGKGQFSGRVTSKLSKELQCQKKTTKSNIQMNHTAYTVNKLRSPTRFYCIPAICRPRGEGTPKIFNEPNKTFLGFRRSTYKTCTAKN